MDAEKLDEIAAAVEKMTPGELRLDASNIPYIRGGDWAELLHKVEDVDAFRMLRHHAAELIRLAKIGYRADQSCRYMLKYQNLPVSYDRSDYQRGFAIACELLEQEFIKKQDGND